MSPTTLSVFEHGTLRVGKGDDGLTRAEFDALARFNDAHGQRYFRLGHRSLTFRSFVGYIQVGKLGIEILPKVDRAAQQLREHGAWQRFLLEMLRVSIGLPLYSPTDASREIGRPTLLNLVAARFVEHLERLLHEGLAKGYQDVEANGSTFRGRLLGAAHVRANFARADRFYVRYSAFERDVPINRILRAALEALRQHALTTALHARIDACCMRFPEVSAAGVDAELFDRIAFTRSTVRYRHALVLARMILQHRAPELRAGAHAVFAVLFDMNVLWERYVGWLFRRAAPPTFDVVVQEPRDFWRARPRRARRIRPDLIVRDRQSGRVMLVADAKWKALCDGTPDDDHLKQMFVYNNLFGTTQSVLVHPSTAAAQLRLEGEYMDRRHNCGTIEIGLFDGRAFRAEAMVEQVRRLLCRFQER